MYDINLLSQKERDILVKNITEKNNGKTLSGNQSKKLAEVEQKIVAAGGVVADVFAELTKPADPKTPVTRTFETVSVERTTANLDFWKTFGKKLETVYAAVKTAAENEIADYKSDLDRDILKRPAKKDEYEARFAEDTKPFNLLIDACNAFNTAYAIKSDAVEFLSTAREIGGNDFGICLNQIGLDAAGKLYTVEHFAVSDEEYDAKITEIAGKFPLIAAMENLLALDAEIETLMNEYSKSPELKTVCDNAGNSYADFETLRAIVVKNGTAIVNTPDGDKQFAVILTEPYNAAKRALGIETADAIINAANAPMVVVTKRGKSAGTTSTETPITVKIGGVEKTDTVSNLINYVLGLQIKKWNASLVPQKEYLKEGTPVSQEILNRLNGYTGVLSTAAVNEFLYRKHGGTTKAGRGGKTAYTPAKFADTYSLIRSQQTMLPLVKQNGDKVEAIVNQAPGGMKIVAGKYTTEGGANYKIGDSNTSTPELLEALIACMGLK